MNKTVTSKEEILEVSRRIVAEQDISAINMRAVANACGIALGSLYNYFPSKASLLSDTIETVWKDIFLPDNMRKENLSFVEYVANLLEQINQSKKVYPQFFSMHTMSFAGEEKPAGRQMREHYFCHIQEELLNCLRKDSNIRSGVFNEIITKEAFIHHVFTLFLSILPEDADNGKALLEMLRIYLY